MAWTPELRLRGNGYFAGLIVLLHGGAIVAMLQLGNKGWALLPLIIASCIYHCLFSALRWLPGSICRVWLSEEGWHLQQRRGRCLGPFQLTSSSRLDSHFIRLSLRGRARWKTHHLLLTRAIVGADDFRRLQVFLRWAPEKNQPVGS